MDELMSMTMVSSYNQYFCQRYYHWQQENQPSSTVGATSAMATATQIPKTSRKKNLLSDKEQKEMKVRRMIRNRESAARSRSRKLAFIKELQNKVCQLEALIKSLRFNKEFNLQEQHSVQEETKPQLRRCNSAPCL